eukprot:9487590-Pyramimonas_sp.AAC.1
MKDPAQQTLACWKGMLRWIADKAGRSPGIFFSGASRPSMLEGSVVLDPACGPGCSPGAPAATPTQVAVTLANPAPTNAPVTTVGAMSWNEGSPARSLGGKLEDGPGGEEDVEMLDLSAKLIDEFVPAVVECGGPAQYTKRLLYDATKKWGCAGTQSEEDVEEEEEKERRDDDGGEEEKEEDDRGKEDEEEEEDYSPIRDCLCRAVGVCSPIALQPYSPKAL